MKRTRKPAPVRYRDLREVVFHAAERFPDTRFFRCEDAAMPHVTGLALREFCGAFGAKCARERRLGAHIALLGPNGAAWLTCFFSVVCGGAVAVPLHLGTKPEELASCLERSDSTLLLYDAACAAEIAKVSAMKKMLRIFLQVMSTLF